MRLSTGGQVEKGVRLCTGPTEAQRALYLKVNQFTVHLTVACNSFYDNWFNTLSSLSKVKISEFCFREENMISLDSSL